jgi:hypothetical protein
MEERLGWKIHQTGCDATTRWIPGLWRDPASTGSRKCRQGGKTGSPVQAKEYIIPFPARFCSPAECDSQLAEQEAALAKPSPKNLR